MSDHKMTDKDSLLNAAATNVSDDAPSNMNKNVGYGTSCEQNTSLDDKKEVIVFPSCRLVLYLMMFFGFVATYSIRGCFNQTIVAMVNQTAVSEQAKTANTSKSFECPRDQELQSRQGEFNWNRHQQGILLSAFYYGYILTQVTASVLSHIQSGPKSEPYLFHFDGVNNNKCARQTVVLLVFYDMCEQ